jgi:hypothetical protein
MRKAVFLPGLPFHLLYKRTASWLAWRGFCAMVAFHCNVRQEMHSSHLRYFCHCSDSMPVFLGTFDN